MFVCVICDVTMRTVGTTILYCTVLYRKQKTVPRIEDQKLRMELGTNFKLCDRLLDYF